MSSALSEIPELQYADLVATARARLPSLSPEWTDHGPADLGITLVELFAAITEMIRYRTRRETTAMTRAFLELLAGRDIATNPDLAAATRQALAQIWTPYRAVTEHDYETLARDAWPLSPEAAALPPTHTVQLHRTRCLPERDLESTTPLAVAPGHISLVVLPTAPTTPSPTTTALLQSLWQFFDPRRLLTTRHHVVLPTPVPLQIAATIYLDDDVSPTTIATRLTTALTEWMDPHHGGPDSDGWPFGAAIFISDLYALLDSVPGVDFVTDVAATTPLPGRTLHGANNTPVGIHLHPHELVQFDRPGSTLRLFEPTGSTWKELK